MKAVIVLMVILQFVCSCNFWSHETIKGTGNLKTETRNIDVTSRISLSGFFDVEIVQGSPQSIVVEADENLLTYIITDNNNGWLNIHTKDNVNLTSMNKIKVFIRTDAVSDLKISGSGNIEGSGKFVGQNHLKIDVSGSGKIKMETNTPDVEAHISGSGDIELSGETKYETIHISGMGDYKSANLKAENVEVHISGSGNVRVFAESNLNVHIAGSGDVYYRGNPDITKSIAGSGNIRQLEN